MFRLPLRRALAACLFVLAARAVVAAPEETSLTVAVGGQGLYYYLPLAVAAQRGYFEEAGLDVRIADFPGGAKSLQAVVGGSAAFAAGAFEHVLNMQARGQGLEAVVLMARYPGMVLALPAGAGERYRSAADLKGRKVGVTAPGSSTHMFLNHVLGRAGLSAQDVAVIGGGAGASAIAAMRRGEIDALVHLDPVIHQLEAANAIDIVVDTRTQDGANALYGGSYPASCLYGKADYIHAHPETTQAMVTALVRALRWIAAATPAQIADVVPPAFLGGDRAGYIAALSRNLAILSPDGRFDADGAARVLAALRGFEPFMRKAEIDLTRAMTNAFVDRASTTP